MRVGYVLAEDLLRAETRRCFRSLTGQGESTKPSKLGLAFVPGSGYDPPRKVDTRRNT